MTAAARKSLSLNTGEFYKTMLEEVVEILTLDLTDKSAFPLSGITAGDRLVRIAWDGTTKCGDRLFEKVERPIAAPAVDAYLEAAIDDELTLAGLLKWKNFTRPAKITPMCWIQGTHNKHNGHTMRNGSVPMPQWRRSTDAAQLISRCKLTIAPTDGGVAVHAETGPVFRSIYSEHPTEDHAIWFAMCKAAIAYLGAK